MVLTTEMQINYQWLRQYDDVPPILQNRTAVSVFEWMVETLSLSDWQDDDFDLEEDRLAEHAVRWCSVSETIEQCKDAAYLYACWADAEFNEGEKARWIEN